jgi:hypothetical protein
MLLLLLQAYQMRSAAVDALANSQMVHLMLMMLHC